jgi:formate-dependent nitrite reductase membrane component NrfD
VTAGPESEVRSYYGRPVLKEPVWKWPVPAYLFTGGLAGASATLALAATTSGRPRLARSALIAAAAGAAVSPAFLVEDLGRPERFLNMLRVAKPTSPMSVGTWVLSVFAPSAIGAAVSDLTGVRPGAGRVLGAVAGCLGPVMTTYTAVLLADTAIPVWHDARHELPFVFAGSAAASAGAAAVALTPVRQAGPARRMAVAGVVIEVVATQVMERAHGDVMGPYHGEGPAARLARRAKALAVAGGAVTAIAGRRRRWAAVAGAAMVLAGSALERFSVFRAGIESARDPAATVGPQRRRVDQRS